MQLCYALFQAVHAVFAGITQVYGPGFRRESLRQTEKRLWNNQTYILHEVSPESALRQAVRTHAPWRWLLLSQSHFQRSARVAWNC